MTFNSSKYGSSVFNRGSGLYVTSSILSKWNDISYVEDSLNFIYNNINYIEYLDLFKWNSLIETEEFSSIKKWINFEYLDEIKATKWNNISYTTEDTIINWGIRSYFRNLRFNQEKYNKSSFNRGTFYVSSSSIAKWKNRMFTDDFKIIRWNNKIFTDEYFSTINWLNQIFLSGSCDFKWNNLTFVSEVLNYFKWNGSFYNESFNVFKWPNLMFLSNASSAKWNGASYFTIQNILNWNNISGVVFPLNDYLSVKTIQDKYIYPNIINGKISFKKGSIGEANFELAEPIPEDSRCTFYLKGNARMFDGVSRRCVRNSSGTYDTAIQEYSEILKPESGKGGVYLVKNNWHNIKLENLISSLKPSDNNGEIGLIYMAFSAIHNSFFKEYDASNNIFVFEYSGIPYNITEVFEDSNVLPQRSNIDSLKDTTLTTGLDLNGSETSVYVNTTVGFASSGSIYIGSEQISYASKTASQFIGCVRGVGGTAKNAHASGDVVDLKSQASCLLTSALARNGSETVVYVNNTNNFSSSGSFFIGGEEIAYTSKTSTSFVGCSRNYSGSLGYWSAGEHSIGSVVNHNSKFRGWYHDSENKALYIRCSDDTSPYYHVISVPYIWDFKVPIRIGNINSAVSQSSPITIYSGSSGTNKIPTSQPPSIGCYLQIMGTGTPGSVIITGVATDSSTTETISVSDFDVTKMAISAKKWISISNLNISTWNSVIIKSSPPIITFWETANGDVPLDNIELLLTALDLEYEFIFRNGVCYIDISSKIGNGISGSPANHYIEKININSVSEIDMSDSRNMINGVIFTGYGSGAAGVKSGKHINMGRGGRFVLLDDSTVHSQFIADNFVVKYLNEHYLPARSLKFTSSLLVGDVIDQRRIGDTAHISIPSEFIEQDLRVKEIFIKLKPLSQTLTFGDKLISYDDQIKAMRSASERYRKHLQDEIEEFSWSWSENVDSSAARANTFEITSDILKVQKLELTCSTSFHVTDTNLGSGIGGGGGGGGGSTGNEEGTVSTHHHQVVGVTDVPSATVEVSAKGHTHTYSSVSGVPSATVEVSAKGHTHTHSTTSDEPSDFVYVITDIPNVEVTLNPNVACCTAVGCGKAFLTSATTVTGGIGVPTTTAVAGYKHTHSIEGITSGDDSWRTVPTSDHTHSVNGTTSGDDSYRTVSTFDHTHQINFQTSDAEEGSALFTSSDYITQFVYKDQGGILTNIVTGRPYGEGDPIYETYRSDPDYRFKATDIYTLFRGGGNPDLDPEMLLTIMISGPGIVGSQEITGSPFIVKVSDDIGSVLIDNLVKQSGTYTVNVGVQHYPSSSEKVQLRFSMQISGQIFVDTILKE